MVDRPDGPEDLVTASIDDYLLALADGVHKAQKQLSQVSIDLQPGQPAVTYQLPKVEFEFKMTLELATARQGEGETAEGAASMLRMRPLDARRAEGERAEAASTIRGSFVAVPAMGGKPPPVVEIQLSKRTGRQYEIEVQVRSSAGERLPDVEVEFNIDWALSDKLNRSHNLPALLPPDRGVGASPSGLVANAGQDVVAELDAQESEQDRRGKILEKIQLLNGVSRTGGDGRTVNLLSVDEPADSATLPEGIFVAVLIDVLSLTEAVVFRI